MASLRISLSSMVRRALKQRLFEGRVMAIDGGIHCFLLNRCAMVLCGFVNCRVLALAGWEPVVPL